MNGNIATHRDRRFELAIFAANALLLAYIAYLLFANYAGQRSIRASLEERIAHETEKQAMGIGYFLSERRRDAERLARSTEVVAYFENRALGMSLEYGLRATLVQAQQRIDDLLQSPGFDGIKTYVGILLAESNGRVLVLNEAILPDAGQLTFGLPASTEAEWRVVDGGGQGPSMRWQSPVVFKGERVGRIVVWVTGATVVRHSTGGSSRMGVYPISIVQDGKRLFEVSAAPPKALPAEPAGSTVVTRAPIPHTPFELVANVSADRLFGATDPAQQLIGVGAILVAILSGTIAYLRRSQHRRLQASAEASERRLSLVLDATQDGVWDWNLVTGDVHFSDRWFTMLGYRPGELEGHVKSWEVLVHPDDMDTVRDIVNRHLSGEIPAYETEHRCRCRDGSWLWVLDRGKIVERDLEGKPLRMVGTHTDVTARKTAETLLGEANRELEHRVKERTAMLLQSEKMASVGQLAAGIAHEINNPAGFVAGNLDTMKRYVEGLTGLIELQDKHLPDSSRQVIDACKVGINFEFLQQDLPELLSESIEGMSRIAGIVADLRDFSHVDREGDLEECDLNVLIDKAINVAWNELKYKCTLKKEYGKILPVRLNGGQISQVTLNLLVNAAQAMESQGEILIRTEVAGQEVRMMVEDNGPGIPEDHISKIFDPFFTTKPVGKGTGLGLHICQKIVAAHGGEIRVESEIGKGTRFTVVLPLQARPEQGGAVHEYK